VDWCRKYPPAPPKPAKKPVKKTKKALDEEEKARQFAEDAFKAIERGYFLHPKWFITGSAFLFFRAVGAFGEVLREVVREKSLLEQDRPSSLWAMVLADLPTDEEGLASYCASRETISPEKARAFLKGILKSVPKKNWAMVLTEVNSADRPPIIYWLKQNQMYPPV
jgi:hypothetical protein